MTTELVLLLGLFAFITGGVFFGPRGPRAVFDDSAPRLGARLERHISTGRQFKTKDGPTLGWEKPPGNAPDGSL